MHKRIKGLSEKQMTIVAWLEFYKKYFFTIHDIQHFFKNKEQRYNDIKKLLQKGRIVKINKTKYYLIPIRARTGGWSEQPFIIADEIFNGQDYFIGGWAAANYWKLTEQLPFKIEVFTTKRQGKKNILNTDFIFRRTTKEKIARSVVRTMNAHSFRIMNKKEMKKWIRSKS